ncbi:hypothetical protein Tco_0091356 [Tanacetum coccineum]
MGPSQVESLGDKSKSHKVLGIAPVAIIDRQLPFEYTVTSRSTDVMTMALRVQNIYHSAFRSMFEWEKLSGNNYNDWFCQHKLVLRVEKKIYVIEQSIPPAPAADSTTNMMAKWNVVYDAYNEVACLMLGTGVERFDLIQTFHACKQEEGKPIAAYVLQMKGYVEQLEHLGYVLPQNLSVGLILNGLNSDFAGFVRNYNMHNMGKTIDELHAMLIEYEKGHGGTVKNALLNFEIQNGQYIRINDHILWDINHYGNQQTDPASPSVSAPKLHYANLKFLRSLPSVLDVVGYHDIGGKPGLASTAEPALYKKDITQVFRARCQLATNCVSHSDENHMFLLCQQASIAHNSLMMKTCCNLMKIAWKKLDIRWQVAMITARIRKFIEEDRKIH